MSKFSARFEKQGKGYSYYIYVDGGLRREGWCAGAKREAVREADYWLDRLEREASNAQR